VDHWIPLTLLKVDPSETGGDNLIAYSDEVDRPLRLMPITYYDSCRSPVGA
jgi:hypothetical protein